MKARPDVRPTKTLSPSRTGLLLAGPALGSAAYSIGRSVGFDAQGAFLALPFAIGFWVVSPAALFLEARDVWRSGVRLREIGALRCVLTLGNVVPLLILIRG